MCPGFRLVSAVLSIVACTVVCRAAFERLPEGGRAAAMGGVAIAVADDPWALWVNPSLAASMRRVTISAYVAPKWMGIEDLTRKGASCAVPVGSLGFACALTQFGFPLYNETSIGAVCSGTVLDRVEIGCALKWYHLRIERYGQASAVGLDFGGGFLITPTLRLGASAMNVTGTSLGASREPLPQELLLGVQYAPFDGARIACDLRKENDFPVGVNIGVEYSLFECLHLFAGATDAPSSYSAGAGITLLGLEVAYGLTIHPELGTTAQLSVAIRFGSGT